MVKVYRQAAVLTSFLIFHPVIQRSISCIILTKGSVSVIQYKIPVVGNQPFRYKIHKSVAIKVYWTDYIGITDGSTVTPVRVGKDCSRGYLTSLIEKNTVSVIFNYDDIIKTVIVEITLE